VAAAKPKRAARRRFAFGMRAALPRCTTCAPN
jgi:hypothetical protein